MDISRAENPYSASFGEYTPQPLSVAVDEIYSLRAFLAHIAGSLQADLEMATLPATVRRRHEELLPLLQKGVEGESLYGAFEAKAVLRAMNVPDTLSNHEWAENQGVTLR